MADSSAPARRLGERILVVEDDADVRESISGALSDEGYAVESCADGQAAIERLMAGAPPALMLLDLKMPRRSGWELLSWIRDSVSMLDLPVIVCSANIGFPPLGAVAWLRKPVRTDDLIRKVGEVLEQNGPRRAV